MIMNPLYNRLDSRAEENVLNRGQELLLIPASIIACAIDAIIALSTCGVGIVCAIAGNRKVLEFSCNYFDSSESLIAGPYKHFVRVLNPQAQFHSKLKWHCLIFLVGKKISDFMIEMAKSDKFFQRHIVVR